MKCLRCGAAQNPKNAECSECGSAFTAKPVEKLVGNFCKCGVAATIRVGPIWFCATHDPYARTTPARPETENYRQRWYRERGLPYEPPSLKNCPPFMCVGLFKEIKRPQRQPGEGSDKDIYGEAA